MILECLGRYDTPSNGGVADFDDTVDGAEGRHDHHHVRSDRIEEDELAEMLEESKIPLYEGC
jgi:hypothetical protein